MYGFAHLVNNEWIGVKIFGLWSLGERKCSARRRMLGYEFVRQPENNVKYNLESME